MVLEPEENRKQEILLNAINNNRYKYDRNEQVIQKTINRNIHLGRT